MSLFRKKKKLHIEIPVGVCPVCWEKKHINEEIKKLLVENNISQTKETHVKAFTVEYIKNFKRELLLKNKNGILYCPDCTADFPDYSFVDEYPHAS